MSSLKMKNRVIEENIHGLRSEKTYLIKFSEENLIWGNHPKGAERKKNIKSGRGAA